MKTRIAGVLLIVPAIVLAGLAPLVGQEKSQPKEQTIEALFAGLPADLQAKVKTNPVRCDRVNDWLKENVASKGKNVKVRAEVAEVSPARRDGNYLVHLKLEPLIVKFLGDDWKVALTDVTNGNTLRSNFAKNFSFEAVGTPDAEKLCDAKHVMVSGHVREVRVPRPADTVGLVVVVLEDVEIDGKAWKPYISPIVGGGKGGFNPGGDNPFGGGGKKGKGGAPKDTPKEAPKKDSPKN
jgi:hypothetical protein